MASNKLFNIIYENPRDLERPKEILMFLDGQNGIQRRDPIPPVRKIAEERPVIAVRNDPPPAVSQQAAIVRPPHIPQEPLIRFDLPPVPVIKLPAVPENNEIIMRCKTLNCRSFWNREQYHDICLIFCTPCGKFNCFKCDTIHTGQSCRDYQANGQPLEIQMVLDNPVPVMKKRIPLRQCIIDDNKPIQTNQMPFECIVCYTGINTNEGIRIRACKHQFCRDCLRNHIEYSSSAEIECPYNEDEPCKATLEHREIRALISQEKFDQFLNRCLQEGQTQMTNSFQCKTPDCTGLWVYDDDVTTAKCYICQIYNCHQCKAIHTGLSCRAYQDKIFTENDPTSIQTRNFFEQLIRDGEAMKCPQCDIIISRNEGCEWVQCTMCKLEICWATKGPRWGPGGKGDTSGGCKCGGTKGPKCHPKCNYCH